MTARALAALAAPFTGLDLAFARFLEEREPSADAGHAWLAALVSHQWGRGHACLDLEQLGLDPAGVLGWDPGATRLLPPSLRAAAATLPWARGPHSPLVRVDDVPPARLYLRRAWLAEQRILASLAARIAEPPEVPVDLASRLEELFPALPAGRVDWQRRACELAARSRFTVITGGPGTGKTTTVARLLALLAADARARGATLRAHFAAPTGKAASRLGQSIGARLQELPEALGADLPAEATTLHKLLGLRGGDRDGATAPLASDLVIVDEASMIDLEMMARLLDAVPNSARLVLLGDKDQLASVEAGAVLAQLCERPQLAAQIVTLRHSHRFAEDSGIGRWARTVNAADAADLRAAWQECPVWAPGSTAAVARLRVAGVPDAIFTSRLRAGWSLWLKRLGRVLASGRDCDDADAAALLAEFGAFQVLAALRAGPWGAVALNPVIQRALGFPREPWFAGRPVMVTHNDYSLRLMNGDVGLCLPRDGALRVVFRDAQGALRWVSPSRLESVETVFAMTVHKSQGSEFSEVLLVLPDQIAPVLTRELLYTGITRAMQRLTLLVPSQAVLLQALAARVRRSGGLAL